jgi:iron complex outermembrane receptor protein
MKKLVGGGLLLAAAAALAQEDSVVITATRAPRPSLEVPASVDRLYADEIREGRPQVNLSESMGRVPGIVVQDRGNYAQDFRVQSRGFGARAAFGVRGIRLIADGIPATMPDGQGQGATFALGSAESIEVLRGPFSSLYGNAAGGVIVVETEDPPAVPTVGGDFFAGRYGTWRAGVRLGGYNTLFDASRFETDGYRDHSAAQRDHFNLKFAYPLGRGTTLTLVGNQLRQPQTQDPLGLTRAQFEANPQQVVPQALIFDTRKTVYQEQLGATLSHRLGGGSTVEAMVYGGSRWVEQYLGFAGSAPATTSGGVIQLDRGYGGGALRYSTGDVVRFAAGIEYERMAERRKGFVNNNGVLGELRRDEDDTVSSTALYAQAEWRFAERWSVHGGVRSSQVEFKSEDYFIVPGNPDDSGSRDYSATTPLAGIVFRQTRTLSWYATFGEGFETPTFAELAHQNVGSGLNFALDASRSRHLEAGMKAIVPGTARVNFALFNVETEDEIVVDTSLGGRTTFKNAGRTERRGWELAAETISPGPWGAQFAYSRLDATFRDAFVSNNVPVAAGNVLPAVPSSQVYAQVSYRRPRYYGYLEGLRRSEVAVNDVNSDFAEAYTLFNLVAGLVQEGTGWRITEFVRIDNLTDRNYSGSVVVNDANGRFFEPAPRRSIGAGIQASLQF